MNSDSRERRQKIIAEVFKRKHVTAPDLATEMDVSQATIRRDFRALADSGQLNLVYGGATVVQHKDYSFGSKYQRNSEAKQIIAALAAGMIADGDQLLLDSGTTCYKVAGFLRNKRGLSVIVNSLPLALELGVPGTSVILLGGKYRQERMDTVGPLCINSLDQLRTLTVPNSIATQCSTHAKQFCLRTTANSRRHPYSRLWIGMPCLA